MAERGVLSYSVLVETGSAAERPESRAAPAAVDLLACLSWELTSLEEMADSLDLRKSVYLTA